MLKDRMIAFAGIFGKRYSKKQKIRFLRYIQSSAQEKASRCIWMRGSVWKIWL